MSLLSFRGRACLGLVTCLLALGACRDTQKDAAFCANFRDVFMSSCRDNCLERKVGDTAICSRKCSIELPKQAPYAARCSDQPLPSASPVGSQ